jgi:hypothetical protein
LIVYLPNIQEWDDYRENKKDYSGLKIESLKIEEPQEEEEEETEINEVRSFLPQTHFDLGVFHCQFGESFFMNCKSF